MTRYTSHKLLGSIELEIDWEDAGFEDMGPADAWFRRPDVREGQ